MTPRQARDAVGRIRAMAGDDEGAHAAEDAFRAEVLRCIAEGDDVFTLGMAAQLAAIALSTSDIDFARWCA